MFKGGAQIFGKGLLLLILVSQAVRHPHLSQSIPPSIDVGGEISVNTTWTLADSPYSFTSDVHVQQGVTLTIEPGVIVLMNWRILLADGFLVAEGTEAQPITFKNGYLWLKQNSTTTMDNTGN